ncbi:type II toxin-antitoxin system VapC family toxin [Cyclobacterium marinum]|uniref:PilT protein domain protein n=1 Tax=Cyclobacterium marinum (strain ATCC 25205 / DSM 745 / LMG 13164 / NCIMB 1802) TaxID=880070 RepID=G0J2M9_CYCMS|nr:PIN domain-containing protein [Cyclobacterium marinum]AEL26612.1 PilT protein domain protein [Cyclobacterium marinum DSM 745]MBR9776818.1 PIN domain-containing protein [Cytophagales bacterium]|tara:strand:+ start:4731 stop:5144 length:414 start_codon:yes stop_codon:yes gene_type:complete
MNRILVDTNVVLDLLGKRKSFLKEAQELFTLGDKGKVKLFVSALTFANTYYILSQQLKVSSARKVLRQFKVLVEVVPMDDKVIELALDSEFKDFEDAIQYYSAIENGVRIIITRNQKDFKHSKIPVLSAKEYLGMKG